MITARLKKIARLVHKKTLGSPHLNNRTIHRGMAPNYCELIVTQKCFFRCMMCDLWKTKSEETPTIEQWKSFITDLRQKTPLPFRIGICGGEVLAYPNLSEIIRHCSKIGFDVYITTNGWMLNKKKIEELDSAGLKEIILSIDSIDEKTHDRIRGVNGSYKRIMKSLKLLPKYGRNISINVIAVISSLNIQGLKELVEWADSVQQINSINFNAITEPLNSGAGEKWHIESNYSFLWPDNVVTQEVLNQLIDMKNKGSKIGNSLLQLKAFKKYFKEPEKFIKRGSCHMGRSLSINSEGYMFMCHYYGDIGNIKKDSIIPRWDDEKSFEIRKQILSCQKNCKMLINCNFDE